MSELSHLFERIDAAITAIEDATKAVELALSNNQSNEGRAEVDATTTVECQTCHKQFAGENFMCVRDWCPHRHSNMREDIARLSAEVDSMRAVVAAASRWVGKITGTTAVWDYGLNGEHGASGELVWAVYRYRKAQKEPAHD